MQPEPDWSHPTLPASDGRARRQQATHDRMIDACRQQMRAGNLRPRVTDIADAAGCGPRLVHVHFESMAALYMEALKDRDLAQAILARIPHDDDGLLRAVVTGEVG